VLRRASVVLACLGLLGATSACSGDDDTAATTLPPITDDRPAEAYRIVYQVTTPDAATTEELQVRRPFGAHVIQRDADGEISAQRWSALGAVVTQARGAEVASLSVAAATALGDSRLDRVAAELIAAGRLTEGASAAVGGRRCTYFGERTTAAALPSGADPNLTEAERINTVVDRCVDGQGIVLEERWSSPGGERLLTKRATTLQVGDDAELDLDPPDAVPAAAERGNGFFQPLDRDAGVPFAERFSLPDPEGFRFEGRYLVVPPRVGASDPSSAVGLELVTDVWVRGADVVLFDQGAGTGGATPFDDRLVWREIALPELGTAVLAGDIRAAEVRVRRPGGGFVRLAGTVPVDELLALAETIRLDAAAP
jgi:hypothetical protein